MMQMNSKRYEAVQKQNDMVFKLIKSQQEKDRISNNEQCYDVYLVLSFHCYVFYVSKWYQCEPCVQ